MILPEHEAGVASLTTLANLIGCGSTLWLPDERRPDVLRCDVAGEVLYVGEAKHAEGPTDRAALARLRSYLEWIKAYWAEGTRTAILAMCFTQVEDGPAWTQTLLASAGDAGLPPPMTRSEQIDTKTNILVLRWEVRSVGPR